MKAIILAAGFGTRLYPLTKNIPKALLQLGGKTILDHLVEKLELMKAISEVIVVTNGRFYLDFHEWRKRSSYKKPIHLLGDGVFDPEKRFGAVRDLHLALRSGFCGGDDFVVFCGDNYFDFPIGYFLLPCLGHKQNVFVGTYDVKEKAVASGCGVVLTDSHNRIVGFEEKPADPKSTRVSIGVYCFPAAYRLRVYEYLEIEKLNPDRIGDFIAWLSEKEPLYAVDFDGTWFDIGTLDSYELAQRFIAMGNGQAFTEKAGIKTLDREGLNDVHE
ncbi:MAG TPA: nucleotidyltransferase family protein [Candidatus Omnitrophota bacterium]|nr:nucleotidyltransferase family protein [Candidatus Omnitrophota bacterium]